ncbi:uncharacterized protein LAESUDRAFT_311919 [Laetiporus sulphureus 93-53]|uniref:Uncharacterized protein n=1 Tax=Laetiporus sulphureus 93-53 TaxID=1314785 RepID=A0A165D4V7_9APHY|nr:uncharacterized protein LAESUDRAFT_311919 [Laetiporus sulphureus 93-53]KZT04156.1 hypothetical protein LAESUDRAFT_311919 [Laetiporus sulphureus 93-53]
MVTCPMECDWNTTLVNPEDDHRTVVASPTKWSDESDSWFDDEQEFDADALANAEDKTFTDSGSVRQLANQCPFYSVHLPTRTGFGRRGPSPSVAILRSKLAFKFRGEALGLEEPD